MDHNNKHLLPGFQFPAAFAGLQNAGAASSLISTLSHLSGLSAPMLQPALSTAELAQWAAAQQAAAMFGPMYAKSLEIAQQNLQSAVNGTTSSTIFPALMKQVTATKVVSPRKEPVDSPCAPEPLSNASSSHQSTSTPQEIDVGMVSTTSQTHAFDLSAKTTSPAVKLNEHSLLCEPSTSTSFNSLLTGSLSSNFNTLMTKPLPTGLSSLTQAATTTVTKEEAEELDPSELLAVSLFANAKPTDLASKGKLASLLTSSASAFPTTSTVKRHEQEENDHDVDKMFDFNPTERDEASPAFGLFSATNDGGLSPVQFTPPDSPTHTAQEDDLAVPTVFSARPTPAPTPFLVAPPATPVPVQMQVQMQAPAPAVQRPRPEYDPFKIPTVTSVKTVRKEPFQARPIIKANKLKVPVYKQKRLANYRPDDNGKSESTGDAYSFSDEEEHSITKMDPKDRLDAEVREKLSRIAGQGGDNKNKNVYVPGVGFAVPQEQPQQDLWRNVVLKKRPMLENRPMVPSANLLPASVHAEACQVAARLAEPEIVTLAESLRRRKKARYACPFIKTEPTTSTDCVKEEGTDERIAEMRREMDAQPKLPKLIIKIPKKSEERMEKKKKKKKRKREEDDSDWEGSRKNKKHKKRRTSENRRNSGYEVRMVDAFNQPVEDIKDIKPMVKEEKIEAPINFKKKRLLQDWQEGQINKGIENGERKYNGVKGYTSLKKFNFADFNTDAINQRLSKFCQADGNITKGTFVVNKSELFRDDCALWKVDNPNMLQKFPPRIDPTTKNVTYKSSSTYSGWCEQISSGYYKVAVRFIKQTRSESIVEPEIPLSDLFPAMTSELSDNNGFIPVEEELPIDPNDHMHILRDQRRMDLLFLTRVIVDHALTLEHLQLLKEKTDWTFLKALAGVQKLNNDSIEKIRLNSSMRTEIEDTLKDYIKMSVGDMDSKGFLCKLCQACKYEKRPVEKVIQLLGRQPYDPDTLLPKDRPRVESIDDDDEPLPATELFMCNSCATAAQYFHKCHHMLFHLLVSSENKLESLGTLHSEYKPELIVEQAKKSRNWQSKVFAEILDMWKKIETMPVATMSAPAIP